MFTFLEVNLESTKRPDRVDELFHIGGSCSTDSTSNLKGVWQKAVGDV